MHNTFDTPAPIDLFVELGSGRIVTTATETDRTEIAITGPRADEFTVEQDGNRIRVIAPKSRLGFFGGNDDHVIEATLPTGSDLETRCGSADVACTGTYGAVHITSGSGDIRLDDTTGATTVKSGSGDVRIQTTGNDLQIKSGSGDVSLGETHGLVGVSTGSGDVSLQHARATTVVKTGSGDLSVVEADQDVSLSTASGDLTVGRASRGKITAKNVSGDVRVGIVTGTPVWTDVSSTTGRVRSNLHSAGKPAEGQDYVELRATSVTGDIVLEQV